MSTETTLGAVHVFPSTASYEANKGRVGENDLSLVPVSLVPSGTIIQFAGKTIPDGYLSCNGALVSRTQFADLFAAIGTTWGTGDGKTTFKLPNMHHRFLEGTTTTSEVGTYVEAGLPNISGWLDMDTNSSSACLAFNASGAFAERRIDNPSGSFAQYDSSRVVKYHGRADFAACKSNALYSKAPTVQPSALRLLAIVKV